MNDFNPEKLDQLAFVTEVIDSSLDDIEAVQLPSHKEDIQGICELAATLPAEAIEFEIARLAPYQPDILAMNKITAELRISQITEHNQKLGSLLPFVAAPLYVYANASIAEHESVLEAEPNSEEEQAAYLTLLGVKNVLERLKQYPECSEFFNADTLQADRQDRSRLGEKGKTVVAYILELERLASFDLTTITEATCMAKDRASRIKHRAVLTTMLNQNQPAHKAVRAHLQKQGKILQVGKYINLSESTKEPVKNVYRILSRAVDAERMQGEDVYCLETLIVWQAVVTDDSR